MSNAASTSATATATATATAVPTLESLIASLIETERDTGVRQYGVRRDVASGLNRAMDFDWYDKGKGDKSQEGKMANSYRKTITDALKEAQHSNPRQVWAKICEYGREERGVLKPTANKSASERFIAAIKSAYKAGGSMEAPSESEVEATLTLQRVLHSLGVDTTEA